MKTTFAIAMIIAAASGAVSAAAGGSAQSNVEFAYISVVDGNFEVFGASMADPSGRNLTNDPGLDYQPSWSWAGERVLFYSNRSGNNEIYSMTPGEPGAEARNLSNHPASDTHPTGGPGGRVAFVSDRDGDRELYLWDPDAPAIRQLTDNDHYDDAPAWSPDARTLAYTAIADDEGDIFLLTVESGEVRNLVVLEGHESSPSFSPDGRRIAFNGQSGETVGIYLINVDGTGLQRLPNQAPDERHPRFSPDGEHLLYTVSDGNSAAPNTDIWIMRTDGTDRHPVIATASREEFAIWRPVRGPGSPVRRPRSPVRLPRSLP